MWPNQCPAASFSIHGDITAHNYTGRTDKIAKWAKPFFLIVLTNGHVLDLFLVSSLVHLSAPHPTFLGAGVLQGRSSDC